MPIPTLVGDLTREEIIAKYGVEPYNWKKKFQFEWVEVDQRTGGFQKKTFDVNADAMPCSVSDDSSYQLSFVQFVPSGVAWTCAICRKTEGPLSFEASGIRLVDQRQITLTEAWETIRRTNQTPPIGLPAMNGREGFRVK